MSRPRTIVLAAAILFAGAGGALVAPPAMAAEATPGSVPSTPRPCPLSETQLASGRLTLASAQQTIARGQELLGSQPSRPWEAPTPITNPVTMDEAITCLMAIADVAKKSNAAKQALDQLTACLAGSIITGSSCNAERSNANAALHDVEMAVNLLKYACPWVTL